MFFCIDLVFATNFLELDDVNLATNFEIDDEAVVATESIIIHGIKPETSSEIIEDEASARIITSRNSDPDITANILNSDNVITNAVIDPITKGNISTYIVKENAEVTFYFLSDLIDLSSIQIQNFYYRTINNRTVKVRCRDFAFNGHLTTTIIPDKTYSILKATNRLEDALFIYQIDYKVSNADTVEDKSVKFAFRIVSDKEYDMYKGMESKPVVEKNNGEIKRPKKVEN